MNAPPKRLALRGLFALAMFFVAGAGHAATVLWQDNFDRADPTDLWAVDGGVWQLGAPTNPGGPAAFSGSKVAATGLSANYPIGAISTRLIRLPAFVVPAASENPRLRFRHWFSWGAGDGGYVELKDGSGPWVQVSPTYGSDGEPYSGVWANASVDLSAYAGRSVQIAFHFGASADFQVGPGWFVDDVSVVTGPYAFANPEGFEEGWGDWYSDGGLWEIGAPSGPGPGAAHSGSNVAGTVLSGYYPAGSHSTRLVSPPVVIPEAAQNPNLRFWHWFAMGADDSGVVEIKLGQDPWTPISPSFTGNGGGWTRPFIDLSSYGGQTAQFAFRLVAEADFQVGPGWYIDDVRIVGSCAPALTSAASRKVHGAAGTFDLLLSATLSNPTTEPRLAAGGAHAVVFTLDKAPIGGDATIVEGAAVAGVPTISGNEISVPLSGVDNGKYVTVAIGNIATADCAAVGSASVRIGFLAGDVSQNRVVTVADLAQVNAQIAQSVTASNFLKDVNASGTLTVADKGIANTQITKALPAP